MKAQIHGGGRGLGHFKKSGMSGGVQFAETMGQVREMAPQMLGDRLVTKQTGEEGRPVNDLFVVERVALRRELYLSIVLDRLAARAVLMASAHGGGGIEEVEPQRIMRIGLE